MGRRTRHGHRVAVLLVGLALVAGCSGGDDAADTTDAGAVEETRAADDGGDTGAVGEVGASGGESGDDDAGTSDGAAPGVAVGGGTAGRDVIREAHLTLASDDPAATVDAIGQAAERAGGFVSDTDLHRDDGILAGTVTVRVPADQLPDTLGRIEQAGAELRSRELSSQDVTGEVDDVEAQLRNLRALETELVALLAEARAEGGTEAVLTVFDRVRGVRDEIERLDGRRATLADLVSLATVTVRVEPTEALLADTARERDPEPAPWQPGRQVELAWDGTVGALRATADVVVVLGVTVLPLLLLWGLPVLALVALVRRYRHVPSRTGD